MVAVTLVKISPGDSAKFDLNITSKLVLSPAATVKVPGAALSKLPESTVISIVSEKAEGFSTIQFTMAVLVDPGPGLISTWSLHSRVTSGAICAETGEIKPNIIAENNIVQMILATLDILRPSQRS